MPSLESRNDMLRCDRQWRNKFIVNGTWTMFHNVLNMHAIMGIGTRIKFLQSIQTSAYITMHHCLCLLVGRSINWQILKGQNVNNANPWCHTKSDSIPMESSCYSGSWYQVARCGIRMVSISISISYGSIVLAYPESLDMCLPCCSASVSLGHSWHRGFRPHR